MFVTCIKSTGHKSDLFRQIDEKKLTSSSDLLPGLAASGFKPKYSDMKTLKIKFHLRIVGRSSADASSYSDVKQTQSGVK
jgi:hypothetical protein